MARQLTRFLDVETGLRLLARLGIFRSTVLAPVRLMLVSRHWGMRTYKAGRGNGPGSAYD